MLGLLDRVNCTRTRTTLLAANVRFRSLCTLGRVGSRYLPWRYPLGGVPAHKMTGLPQIPYSTYLPSYQVVLNPTPRGVRREATSIIVLYKWRTHGHGPSRASGPAGPAARPT